MKRGDPKLARAALFEVIENQLRDNDPPETRRTLDRLLGMGLARDEALKLIASALVSEIYGVLKSEAPYDNARYVASLQRLPKLPWDDD